MTFLLGWFASPVYACACVRVGHSLFPPPPLSYIYIFIYLYQSHLFYLLELCMYYISLSYLVLCWSEHEGKHEEAEDRKGEGQRHFREDCIGDAQGHGGRGCRRNVSFVVVVITVLRLTVYFTVACANSLEKRPTPCNLAPFPPPCLSLFDGVCLGL